LKWGLIAIGLIVGWRYLSVMLSGIGSSGVDSQQIQAGVPSWAPNYYYGGVYGPIAIPRSNPFYSSPDNPRSWVPRWSGRVHPM